MHAQIPVVGPGQVPKRGRGGTLTSRQRMLHALVHTESWAVDLAWDVIARFGGRLPLPRAFFDDFVAVAADEARHYSLLQARRSLCHGAVARHRCRLCVRNTLVPSSNHTMRRFVVNVPVAASW